MLDRVAQETNLAQRGMYGPPSSINLEAPDSGRASPTARALSETVVIRRAVAGDRTSSYIGRAGSPRLASSIRRRRYALLCRWTDPAAALAVSFALLALPHGAAAGMWIEELLATQVRFWHLLLLVVAAVSWQRALFLFGLYDHRRQVSPHSESLAVAMACTIGGLAFPVFGYLALDLRLAPTTLFIVWFGSIAAVVASRRSVWAFAARSPERRRVLVIGSGPRARAVASEIRAEACSEYELVGFVDTPSGEVHADVRALWIGKLHELERVLMRTIVDEVIIALPVKSCYAAIQEVIETCERSGVESKYLADLFTSSMARSRYDSTTFPAVAMSTVVQDDQRVIIKRAVDLAGATAALFLLSPVFLAVAIAVKLTSPGPVIFAQERVGLRKRRFRMFKFRTMVADAEIHQQDYEAQNEATGPVFKISCDPRLTTVGRILRRTSLDEFPQFINVLLGDMSLVGPRPMSVRDVEGFSDAWLMRRFSVIPGITCLWQVSGRCKLTFDDWIRLDLQYIDEWSLALDFKILLRTVPAVLRGTGAV